MVVPVNPKTPVTVLRYKAQHLVEIYHCIKTLGWHSMVRSIDASLKGIISTITGTDV